MGDNERMTRSVHPERACSNCGSENADDARFCSECGVFLREEQGEAVADPFIGRTVAGRYRVDALIGRGAMGVVYRVRHIHINRNLALKLLHGELATRGDIIRRFRREAETASQLTHPNTVQVFDFGVDQGLTYLVMEYVEGQTLAAYMRRHESISFEAIAKIGVQICASLSEAHQAGIIHRDIKPDNVMLIGEPESLQVKVLDFGLAKLRDSEDASMTREGTIVGTPYYMSPEQIRGESVDGRSDLYSLAATLYHATTGQAPFRAATPVGVLTQHLSDQVVPPSKLVAGLDERADDILVRGLAKKPDKRFADAAEFSDALAFFLETSASEMRAMRANLNATRADLDRYQRRVKWIGRMRWALLAVAIVLLAVFGYSLRRGFNAGGGDEIEPNHHYSSSEVLSKDVMRHGQLGKRLGPRRADEDLFRLDGDSERPVYIKTNALPNADMELALFAEGEEFPLVSSNRGGVGENEVINGVVLDPKKNYFIRVSQPRGAMPVENISDRYGVIWSDAENVDMEPNDRLEAPAVLVPGSEQVGVIGWQGDADAYCISSPPKAMWVTLEAKSQADFSLRLANRHTHKSYVVNQKGVGGNERFDIPQNTQKFDCIVVTAANRGQGYRYMLKIER